MKFTITKLSVLLCAMLFAGWVMAADQDQTRDRDQLQDQDQTQDRDRLQDKDVYGWQLMTPKERNEYQDKIRNLKTEQEREAYRNEHHKRMQERAKEQGITLPETPMMRQHSGSMSPGGGMGPGGNR